MPTKPCIDNVRQVNHISNMELDALVGDVKFLLDAAIGQPINPARSDIEDAYKNNRNDKAKKRLWENEKKREKEHKLLHDTMTEFVVNQVLSSQLKGADPSIIVDVLEGKIKYRFGTFMGKLWHRNAKEIHDFRLMLKGFMEEQAKGYIGDFSNTLKDPQAFMLQEDKLGYGHRLVQATKAANDNVVRESLPYTDRATAINDGLVANYRRTNTQKLTQQERKLADEAIPLVHDIMDGRKRKVVMVEVPYDEAGKKKFFDSPIGKYYKKEKRSAIGGNTTRVHRLENEDGSKSDYVMVRLNDMEINDYNKLFDRNEPTGGYLWVAIPYIENTKSRRDYEKGKTTVPQLREGWYEASDHQVLEQQNAWTSFTMQGYTGFTRMKQQPNKRHFIPSQMNTLNVWEAVERYRELGEKFFEYMRARKHNFESKFTPILDQFNRMINIEFKGNVEQIKAYSEKIAGLIGTYGMVEVDDSTGQMIAYHSQTSRADLYSPTRYRKESMQDMLDNKVQLIQHELKEYIEGINRIDRKVKEETDDVERAKMLLNRKRLQEKYNEQEALGNTLLRSLKVSLGKEKFDSSVMKVSHLEHRSLWTNKMERDRSPQLWDDYIEHSIRSLEMNDLKAELMQSIMYTPPHLHNYLMNEVKHVVDQRDTDAGFLFVKYNDSKMLQSAQRIFKNMDDKLYSSMLGWHRSIISGWNLSWLTAGMNNLQRVNYFINYGREVMGEANDLVNGERHGYKDKKYVQKLVENTGVLDPLVQFTDVILGGLKNNEHKLTGFAMPLKDIYLMKSKKAGKLDELIAKAQGKDKLKLEELKKMRENFSHILSHNWKPDEAGRLKERIRDLELGLTDEYMNRIVEWRLKYFPITSGAGIATMHGTEKAMRTEGAALGFIEAERRGMLDLNDPGERFMQERAVGMARAVVYHTQFAFDPINSPKFMRSAFGRFFFQFKQYQYQQGSMDFKIWDNLRKTTDGSYFKKGFGMGTRLTREAYNMARGDRTEEGIEKDETARSVLRWTMTRGLFSMLSLGLYVPVVTEVYRFATNRIFDTNRLARGLESPLIVYPGRLARLALFALTTGLDDDDAERTAQEVIMDWFNPLLNLLIGISMMNPHAPTAYIPPGAKEVYKGRDAIKQIMEE